MHHLAFLLRRLAEAISVMPPVGVDGLSFAINAGDPLRDNPRPKPRRGT